MTLAASLLVWIGGFVLGLAAGMMHENHAARLEGYEEGLLAGERLEAWRQRSRKDCGNQ